jgi:hypothetical protein
LLFHTQQYPPYLYTVRTDRCTAVSPTAVPTISIYFTYRRFALLFLTHQYTPYLYTIRSQIFTAVSHIAVPTVSIYSTYRQLHCCFTYSSTHHIYILYVPTFLLLFHLQQYSPYLYTVRSDIFTAVSTTAVPTISTYSTFPHFHCCFTQQYPSNLYTLPTDNCTDVSPTAVPTISI